MLHENEIYVSAYSWQKIVASTVTRAPIPLSLNDNNYSTRLEEW